MPGPSGMGAPCSDRFRRAVSGLRSDTVRAFTTARGTPIPLGLGTSRRHEGVLASENADVCRARRSGRAPCRALAQLGALMAPLVASAAQQCASSILHARDTTPDWERRTRPKVGRGGGGVPRAVAQARTALDQPNRPRAEACPSTVLPLRPVRPWHPNERPPEYDPPCVSECADPVGHPSPARG